MQQILSIPGSFVGVECARNLHIRRFSGAQVIEWTGFGHIRRTRENPMAPKIEAIQVRSRAMPTTSSVLDTSNQVPAPKIAAAPPRAPVHEAAAPDDTAAVAQSQSLEEAESSGGRPIRTRNDPPPVQPAEIQEANAFETGILFSDPELSAWWWNSHTFLSDRARLEMAQKVVSLCTSQVCLNMFTDVRDDLLQYMAPVSFIDAARNGIRDFIAQRPVFAACAALALAYFVFAAGMNGYEVFHKLAMR
jgi:hypothetical protein